MSDPNQDHPSMFPTVPDFLELEVLVDFPLAPADAASQRVIDDATAIGAFCEFYGEYASHIGTPSVGEHLNDPGEVFMDIVTRRDLPDFDQLDTIWWDTSFPLITYSITAIGAHTAARENSRYRREEDGRLMMYGPTDVTFAAGNLVAPLALAIEVGAEYGGVVISEDRIEGLMVTAMETVQAGYFPEGYERPAHPELEVLESMRRVHDKFGKRDEVIAAGFAQNVLEYFGADNRIFWRKEALERLGVVLSIEGQ